jgi:glycosyltransferase involved in cell wall biosynthesis
LKKNFLEEIRDSAWQNSRLKTAWFAIVLWAAHMTGAWRVVDSWIAISDFVHRKMLDAGLPPKNVFTLRYHWIPQAEPMTSGEDRHYLFLGRLIEAKGVIVLLEAWRKLEHRLGDQAPSLVIGGSGPLANFVASEAAKLRTVRFAGQLTGEDKKQALASARAVIVPSLWWEALGITVYEAYDHGKPVLAANSGGLTETVINGVTGLLHEPGSSDELAAQVAELDADLTRRRTMGRAGRAWLEANTNEEEWRCQFEKIVHHALHRNAVD